jgi:hypothetical protein
LKILVGRPRYKWKNVIKMDLQIDRVGECGFDFLGQGRGTAFSLGLFFEPEDGIGMFLQNTR